MKELKVVEKDGRLLIKAGRKIEAFAGKQGNTFGYAFAKPSSAQYIWFEAPSIKEAVERAVAIVQEGMELFGQG